MKFLPILPLSLFILTAHATDTTLFIDPVMAISALDEYPTDEQLRQLAIKRGLIPSNADIQFCKEQVKKENSITAWIAMERKVKIAFVVELIKLFKEEDGVIIRNPSEYYTDQLNEVVYRSMLNDTGYAAGKGLKAMFMTIALMEGDFDNGKNKVEALREFVGEERFEMYKQSYPEKYEYLIEMEK